MKRLLLWSAGVALGLWVAREVIEAQRRTGKSGRRINLNTCTREELLALPGVTDDLADRVIDNRPYRHRLDLVARMVLPSGIYQEIRERVDVDAAVAEKPVTVAS